jgi:hypothetical protein
MRSRASETLILLRTHDFGPLAQRQAAWLANVPDVDFAIVMDERKQTTEAPHPKISMTLESLARIGLYAHQRSGWQCGDYCYYHAEEAMPGYAFYWLIEPDVLFDLGDPSSFFALFRNAQHDYLAARFGKRPERWGWAPSIKARGLPVFGGVFPVTRLSAHAIRHLRERRVADSAAPGEKRWRNWPNDESFVASHMVAAGFAAADLNEAAGRELWRRDTLRTGEPFLLDEFTGRAPSGLLYHPVVLIEGYLKKLTGHSRRVGAVAAGHRPVLERHFSAEQFSHLSFRDGSARRQRHQRRRRL